MDINGDGKLSKEEI
jgi:calcium-dependent protein kinase